MIVLSKKKDPIKEITRERYQIVDLKTISDPEILQILAHEKNQLLLNLLIEQEMTIIDMKNETNLNPGTIKRHLNKLIEKGLIFQSRIETNKYGIRMKFYRATAEQFEISIVYRWPDK